MEDLFDPDTGLEVTRRGTPEGWIRITSEPGRVWTAKAGVSAAIRFRNASHILLENITLQGGDRHAVSVEESDHIRIINCDLSGWGRIGVQDLEKDGKYYLNGRSINYDAGVHIDRSAQVVVERCYIHDPRGRANSWTYAHPEGPQAVLVHSRGGTVLRYNDFVGSDAHRWNDAVEGVHNGFETGGFYRDGDVYGNFFAYGNDDGIELDGGQMNLRVYDNRFTGFLCGISTAPCLLGPSYLFRNLIWNLGDEEGLGGSAFKNHHGRHWIQGRAFYYQNSVITRSGAGQSAFGALPIPPEDLLDVRGVMRNNLIHCPDGLFSASSLQWKNDWDGNLYWSANPVVRENARSRLAELGLDGQSLFEEPLFEDPASGLFRLKAESPGKDRGLAIPGFAPAGSEIGAFDRQDRSPYRPIPVRADRMHLDFETSSRGRANPQTVTVTVAEEPGFRQPFDIRINRAFEWLSVEPQKGVLESGQSLRLRVRPIPGRLPDPGLYRGA
ncbi:MAG: right-handed parallel beta-helix repeat-containing protein, partial [Kiritimatiellia bacterium]|nr:right-handed parallel beta-helix repeat-containing protein [Kiritimatiellia bacterium]